MLDKVFCEDNPCLPINSYVNTAINQGYNISVWDGGDWPVVYSTDKSRILAHVWSVESGTLRIYDEEKYLGSASWLLDFPDAEIIDYTIDENNVMNKLWEASR